MDTVRNWMTSPAIVASETMVLPDARRQLREKRIRRMPVINAEGQLVGIITEGDINRVSDSHITDVRDYNMYHRVGDLPIRDIMTRSVVFVSPDTPIQDVARLMYDHRIGGIPVVDQDHIIGMITESDLFRMIVVREAKNTETPQPPAAS